MLRSRFAICHTQIKKYAIGDRFTDHLGTIVIEKIQLHRAVGSSEPFLVFTGKNLTKSGSVSKRRPERQAYEINDIHN